MNFISIQPPLGWVIPKWDTSYHTSFQAYYGSKFSSLFGPWLGEVSELMDLISLINFACSTWNFEENAGHFPHPFSVSNLSVAMGTCMALVYKEISQRHDVANCRIVVVFERKVYVLLELLRLV